MFASKQQNLNIKLSEASDWFTKAEQEGLSQVVEFLEKKGTNLDGEDKKILSDWFAKVTQEGHSQVVEFLKKNETNLDDEDKKILSNWFTKVAQEGHSQVVKLIEKNGINLNDEDKKILSDWFIKAAQKGHSQVLELLVNDHIFLEIANRGHIDNIKGITHLHLAAQKGNEEDVKYLVENGADVNANNEDGWTPLHYAAYECHFEVIEYLVENGADINAETKDDWTPLKLASVRAAHDSPVNATDGCTPLHLAAQNGHLEVVQYLVSIGANIGAVDEQGNTPLDLARREGHEKVVSFLDKEMKKQPPAGEVIGTNVHLEEAQETSKKLECLKVRPFFAESKISK